MFHVQIYYMSSVCISINLLKKGGELVSRVTNKFIKTAQKKKNRIKHLKPIYLPY